ncbi:MAG TPA: AAA family ATPase [Longimicrobiaceae bacterium]|nr:AAA family ATPase [Longimicrobiaceae bacterium]
MQCTRCGFDNPAGMNFCGNCGLKLARQCAACGSDNPPAFRFCGSCGSALEAAPDAAPDPAVAAADPASRRIRIPIPAPAATPPSAERRQLTVMFCDLVGSTSLSARLDPEELREVVGSYQAVCADAIEANEGYIAQYLGDGVLAYFGYPHSTEREAGRAVRAGLAILHGISLLAERMRRERGMELGVRIGIHTGVVVIGEIGAGQKREQLALGETPNLAARIQGLAEPDTLVVSRDTYRLVRDEFECEDLGTRDAKGVGAPVRLYRVVRDTGGELPGTAPGDAPVGREREMAELGEHWQRVLQGRGQVVLVSGDDGMGKSSLVRAFAQEAAAGGATLLAIRCLPHFRNTAYQPVVELLQRALGCSGGEPPEFKLRCLRDLLKRQGFPVAEMMPLFASVLALPYDEGEPDERSSPRRRKERTRAALLRMMLGAAAGGPLLVCVEDVHWADPSTLELLGLLADQVSDRRILAVFTHRLEFRPPWHPPAHQAELVVGRLQQADVEQIIARLTGGKALPPEVAAQIIARTDGVPLFVEELTKTVLESGLLREEDDRYELTGGALPSMAIPTTLHDSLEARLDRLSGTTKELAQIGAVLGREFRYELLQAVSGADPAVLGPALAQLVEAELVYEQGTAPEAVYTFKHALIQEAAYQSLLKGVRHQHHHRAALVLEERFPAEAEEHPELVAQHYTAAGLADPAVEAWIRAGRRAVERSANHEAASHLRHGLELLGALAEDRTRQERELQLLLTLGPALTATLGHAAGEVREVYHRGLQLAKVLGVEGEHIELMGGLFSCYFVRAELAEAFEVAKEMLRAAAAVGHSRWEAPALVAVGVALLKTGSLDDARDYLERALELYDPARHFSMAHALGQDIGVVAWSYSSFVHIALGAADDALRRARRAIELARELDHPHSLAFALTFTSAIHFFRREPAAALEVAQEMEELAERENFPHWRMDVPPTRAWALAALGRTDEAAEWVDGIDVDAMLAAMGVGPTLYRVRVVAESYLDAGRPEQAAPLLARLRGMLEIEAPGTWWSAEVYRAQGAAAAQLGQTDDARAHLERAVVAARAARTPLFLLRGLLDLARLRGGLDAALRGDLAEVCLALADAGDIADLRDARALLDDAEAEADLVEA